MRAGSRGLQPGRYGILAGTMASPNLPSRMHASLSLSFYIYIYMYVCIYQFQSTSLSLTSSIPPPAPSLPTSCSAYLVLPLPGFPSPSHFLPLSHSAPFTLILPPLISSLMENTFNKIKYGTLYGTHIQQNQDSGYKIHFCSCLLFIILLVVFYSCFNLLLICELSALSSAPIGNCYR